MSVKASAKGVRIAPRKVGEVASLVRGHSAKDAMTILDHTPRRSALAVKKVIQSAVANAENNHNYKADTMTISSISVTPGPRIKRYRPAAHGRALPFQRKTSHIYVTLDGEIRAPKKPATKSTADMPKTSKKESK